MEEASDCCKRDGPFGDPADLTITPRDRKFVREQRPARWWNGGDPVATALYNALSATFPEGEAFFVESVRRYRDGAPPRLAGEIKAFTTQEAIHSREHAVFNKAATEAGYDLTPLEQRVHWRLGILNGRAADRLRWRRPWRWSISPPSSPMSCSRIRATWAAPSRRSAAMWKWHAVEEIEHKGVAYDTWLHATRDWPRSKRWKVKAKVMLLVTRNFIIDRTLGSLELLRQDGITGPRRLGSPDLVHVGAAGNDAKDLQRLGQIFPARLPPVERGRPPFDRRLRPERRLWAEAGETGARRDGGLTFARPPTIRQPVPRPRRPPPPVPAGNSAPVSPCRGRS